MRQLAAATSSRKNNTSQETRLDEARLFLPHQQVAFSVASGNSRPAGSMAPIPPQYRAKETGRCDANENMLKIALFCRETPGPP